MSEDADRGRDRLAATMARVLRPLAVPAVAGLVGFWLFRASLLERTDYVGHFIAGFGGTLSLLAFAVFADGVPERLPRLAFFTVIVSIAIGAVCEATVFRIAQFDPIDFLNQSLGAVVAGLAAAASRPERGRATACVFGWAVVALVSLVAGFEYAFA